jgi:RNA polymerase sigma-70 factor, ECF subfamily
MNAQASKTIDTPQLPSARNRSQFQFELTALIPHLRAFSRKLCGGQALGEDLVQETLMKAWRARDRFEPGTNLKAWLFTILRNEISSHARRTWRETHWDTEKGGRIATAPNEQEWAVELSDAARALRGLPQHQREAVLVVGAGGFSHEDSAEICGVAAGTVKSRVARGRAALRKALDGNTPLPSCGWIDTSAAADDILAQLSALTQGPRRHAGPSPR